MVLLALRGLELEPFLFHFTGSLDINPPIFLLSLSLAVLSLESVVLAGNSLKENAQKYQRAACIALAAINTPYQASCCPSAGGPQLLSKLWNTEIHPVCHHRKFPHLHTFFSLNTQKFTSMKMISDFTKQVQHFTMRDSEQHQQQSNHSLHVSSVFSLCWSSQQSDHFTALETEQLEKTSLSDQPQFRRCETWPHRS